MWPLDKSKMKSAGFCLPETVHLWVYPQGEVLSLSVQNDLVIGGEEHRGCAVAQAQSHPRTGQF
jgi:hypothetical protein